MDCMKDRNFNAIIVIVNMFENVQLDQTVYI